MHTQHPPVKKPRRLGPHPVRRKRLTPLDASIMKLLRLGLLLSWFLLIVTSHDDPQAKAIQLMACLMEVLSSASRQEWTG